MNHLLGTGYSTKQMSYDLARLRRNGLIERRPHSNTYILTTEGLRVARFYTKVHYRLLRPLLAADKAPAPAPLRQTLATIDRHVNGYIDDARMKNLPKTQDKHQSSDPKERQAAVGQAASTRRRDGAGYRGGVCPPPRTPVWRSYSNSTLRRVRGHGGSPELAAAQGVESEFSSALKGTDSPLNRRA